MPNQNCTMVEFIEKLVILDNILTPIVNNYFIRYKSFPYNLSNKEGGPELINSLFVVWDYYYKKYSEVKGEAKEDTDSMV